MKTLGLIGGLSWESSKSYYQWLNEGVKERLGGLHSADLILRSLDFAPIEAMQMRGDWAAATAEMEVAAKTLEIAEVDALLICSNTMHKCADAIEEIVDIPLIHIADATAEVIKEQGYHKPLLLGTRFTMEEDFYAGRLRDRHGLNVQIPDDADCQTVHDIIYQELCLGHLHEKSRHAYQQIIDKAAKNGSDCFILGCTEIGLLIKQGDVSLPVLDTTHIHVEAALTLMLS